MRTLTLVLLGSLPLGWLTAQSCFEWWAVAPSVVQAELPTAVSPPTADIQSRCFEGLGRSDVLLGETPEIPAGSATLRGVAGRWPAWEQARRMASQALELNRVQLATTPDAWQMQAARLRGLSAQCTFPAAAKLREHIDLRTAAYEAISRLMDDYNQGRYAQCLTSARDWSTRYSAVAPSLVPPMSRLEQLASFHKEAQTLADDLRKTESPEAQAARVRHFVDDQRHATGGSSKAQTQIAACEAFLALWQQSQKIARDANATTALAEGCDAWLRDFPGDPLGLNAAVETLKARANFHLERRQLLRRFEPLRGDHSAAALSQLRAAAMAFVAKHDGKPYVGLLEKDSLDKCRAWVHTNATPAAPTP